MVHILVSKPNEDRLPLIYNVDGVVGASPAVNRPDDVILVKGFLKMIGDVPLTTASEELTSTCKALIVSATPDPDMITAIRLFQENVRTAKNNPGVVVDGRVSPAQSNYRYDTNIPWTIVQLNLMMKAASRFGPVWPAIHLAPNCNPALAEVAKKTIFGV
jgi:hypothetical protein